MNTTLEAACTRSIEYAMRVTPHVLQSRHIEALPTSWKVALDKECVWLFAVFDVKRLTMPLEKLTDPRLMHQLSTALKGMPVGISNSTGIRIGIQIAGPRNRLLDKVEVPEHQRGHVPIGVNVAGQNISFSWEEIGHVLIGGITGSGKSSLARSIAATALCDGHRLLLADPRNVTFPMLARHPALIAPIARSPQDALQMLDERVMAEIDRRSKLYEALHQQGKYPESLDEYNASNGDAERLPRIVVILDEFAALCEADGGKHSALARIATRCVWEARKFGITLVFAGTDFSRDQVGPMRKHLGTRICFRVESSSVSRMILGHSGAEKLRHPGRALIGEQGMVQTYLYPKEKLISLSQASAPYLSQRERELAVRCRDTNDERFTLSWLQMGAGLAEREARGIRDAWRRAGWLAKDPMRDNADCLTPAVLNLLLESEHQKRS